jgi:OOP family OmpA-OmpF porin
MSKCGFRRLGAVLPLQRRPRRLRGVGAVLAGALFVAGCSSAPVDSGVAGARAPVPEIPGYFTSPRGGPVKDAQGRCWRTADWRPALAIEECDPTLARERKLRELALKLSSVTPPVPLSGAPVEAKFDNAAEVVPVPADASPVPLAGAADVASAAAATTAPAAGVAGAVAAPGTAPSAAKGSGASPAVAVPPARPEYITRPVVLNTDAAFFFGKDRLTAAGKDSVENLAAYIKLWGIEDVQVEVIGHTDRIGSARDNLQLSLRRAEAVKAVLAEAGVPEASISATGVGSAQPVTQPDTCPDDIDRCERINCLAPDRRVEVGLKGTRKAPAR